MQRLLIMKVIEAYIVPENTEAIRFNEYAFEIIKSIHTRSGIKKAIKKGLLIIDGKKVETGRRVIAGMKIELKAVKSSRPKPYKVPIEIIYEDNSIIVVNKKAGLVTSGNQFRTATNVVVYHAEASDAVDRLEWPKPAHRLDAATSGLLIFAKTSRALVHLQKQFERKVIKKRYLAIVNGKTDNKGKINIKIQGKDAITFYRQLNCVESLQNQWLSMVELFPETGRTHQLRIHLSEIGHPIVGDKLYGTAGDILKHKGLFLCAQKIDFIHPELNRSLVLEIEPPPKFKALLTREKRRWDKYNNLSSTLPTIHSS